MQSLAWRTTRFAAKDNRGRHPASEGELAPGPKHSDSESPVAILSVSYSVSPFLTDYETGQITRHKPGQFICSLHPRIHVLDNSLAHQYISV
jgi:hypothetical protein